MKVKFCLKKIKFCFEKIEEKKVKHFNQRIPFQVLLSCTEQFIFDKFFFELKICGTDNITYRTTTHINLILLLWCTENDIHNKLLRLRNYFAKWFTQDMISGNILDMISGYDSWYDFWKLWFLDRISGMDYFHHTLLIISQDDSFNSLPKLNTMRVMFVLLTVNITTHQVVVVDMFKKKKNNKMIW